MNVRQDHDGALFLRGHTGVLTLQVIDTSILQIEIPTSQIDKQFPQIIILLYLIIIISSAMPTKRKNHSLLILILMPLLPNYFIYALPIKYAFNVKQSLRSDDVKFSLQRKRCDCPVVAFL